MLLGNRQRSHRKKRLEVAFFTYLISDASGRIAFARSPPWKCSSVCLVRSRTLSRQPPSA